MAHRKRRIQLLCLDEPTIGFIPALHDECVSTQPLIPQCRRFPVALPLGINGRDPAPGFRAFDEGALWHVGNRGFVWSSAASSIYGLDLSFSSQYLYPSSVDYRGHGLQLRCLSE